jgi:hypothetical protein
MPGDRFDAGFVMHRPPEHRVEGLAAAEQADGLTRIARDRDRYSPSSEQRPPDIG